MFELVDDDFSLKLCLYCEKLPLKQNSPCDLVAQKGSQLFRVEVKSVRRPSEDRAVDSTRCEVKALVCRNGLVIYRPKLSSIALQFDPDIRRCHECGLDLTNVWTSHKMCRADPARMYFLCKECLNKLYPGQF